MKFSQPTSGVVNLALNVNLPRSVISFSISPLLAYYTCTGRPFACFLLSFFSKSAGPYAINVIGVRNSVITFPGLGFRIPKISGFGEFITLFIVNELKPAPGPVFSIVSNNGTGLPPGIIDTTDQGQSQ